MSINEYFFLVTGFHRSGTSLIAKTLKNSGVDMGNSLLGASFANPDGHVEDKEVVSFHDEFLNRNNSDWRYFNDAPLPLDDSCRSKISDYIDRRKVNKSQPIGAKDPRAVNFLDDWLIASNGKLKTIIVYRDWHFSVSSLFKRHSRELFNFLDLPSNRKVDIQFWQYPDLAAKMWLASARKTIYWKKKHPENTLIFDLETFITDRDVVKNEALNVNIPVSFLENDNFQSAFLQQGVVESMLDMISVPLKKECDLAYAELRSMSSKNCTVKANELTFTHLDRNLASIKDSLICDTQEYERLPRNTNVSPHAEKSTSFIKSLVAFTEKSLSDSLDHLMYEKAYTEALIDGEIASAELFLYRANTIHNAPWRWMYLGDLYLAKQQFNMAEICYRRAKELQPENATFYAKLANLQIAQRNREEAYDLIQTALKLDSSKPAIVETQEYYTSQFSKCVTPNIKDSQRDDTGTGFMPIPPSYEKILSSLDSNSLDGNILDKYNILFNFFHTEIVNWFRDALITIPHYARKSFVDYSILNLQKSIPIQTLSTSINQNYEFTETRPLTNFSSNEDVLNLGAHIHVYYLDLLPEINSYLSKLNFHTIVVTCLYEHRESIKKILKTATNIVIVTVENHGRDIYPWLTVADKYLNDCDIVLKVHTKSSPHAAHLSNWRAQLLWSLIADHNADAIIDEFSQNESLGMVIPNYHHGLKNDIGWGQNLSNCEHVANSLGIVLPKSMNVFAAGSMFWYRPKALEKLTNYAWPVSSFEKESGQQDGTTMHAIERILAPVSSNAGFEVAFTSEVTNHICRAVMQA